MVNFYSDSDNGLCSISSKMEVLDMIDKLDANSNVGHIYIGIGSNNQLNYEIVIIMINRFSNVYWIELGDSND